MPVKLKKVKGGWKASDGKHTFSKKAQSKKKAKAQVSAINLNMLRKKGRKT